MAEDKQIKVGEVWFNKRGDFKKRVQPGCLKPGRKGGIYLKKKKEREGHLTLLKQGWNKMQ